MLPQSIRSDRARALARLSEPGAPRVMTPTGAQTWLAEASIKLTVQALARAFNEWQAQGLIEKVRHGIYLNLRVHPRPQADEAASWLRSGAVVSLQRVLGQAGVLNNPTPWITCVLSMAASRASAKIETPTHVFQFSGMKGEMIPAASADWATDAYQPYAQVLTATPEKALMDWLYLAENSPLWRRPPAHDLDLDDLDHDRLDRLANRMGVSDSWQKLRRETGLAETAQTQAAEALHRRTRHGL